MVGIRKFQNCARCRNHGLALIRLKGHKKDCAYKLCNCEKCIATKDRQSFIAKEIAMHRYEIKSNEELANNPLKLNLVRSKSNDGATSADSQDFWNFKVASRLTREVRRNQQCSRCRNHGLKVLLRGHKNSCPFLTCSCDKCEITKKRREIMAKQIKDYRSFKSIDTLNTEQSERARFVHPFSAPFVSYEPMENRDMFFMIQSLYEKYAIQGSEEKIQLIYALADLSQRSWSILQDSLRRGSEYAEKFGVQHFLIAYQNNPNLTTKSHAVPNVISNQEDKIARATITD